MGRRLTEEAGLVGEGTEGMVESEEGETAGKGVAILLLRVATASETESVYGVAALLDIALQENIATYR